jgi:hypothetical protein
MSNTYTNRWSREDHRAFADGVRLRAQTINGRRFAGPQASEWDWDEDDEAA